MPRNVDLSVCTSKQDTISSHQILITEASDSLFRQYDFKNATSIQLGKGVHSCNKDGIYCYGNTILFHRWQRYAESAKTIVFSKDFHSITHDVTEDVNLNNSLKSLSVKLPRISVAEKPIKAVRGSAPQRPRDTPSPSKNI